LPNYQITKLPNQPIAELSNYRIAELSHRRIIPSPKNQLLKALISNPIRTISLAILLAMSTLAVAQIQPPSVHKAPPLTRILFIFDASQSMLGRWQSDTKFNMAKRIVSEMLDSIANLKNTEFALRVYGHQFQFPPQVCTDSRLEVPFATGNAAKIKTRLRTINARGTTPLAYSLEQSAKDFPPCASCRNIVILITDGMEECSGDPCAVSTMLQKNGIVLKPFIIGIGRDFDLAFDCVGTYFDATNEKDLRKALNVVISQALNSTTLQVNLLDESGRPTETDAGMTFYDLYSGKIKYNFIHTMNNRGLPDTLVVDPLITYRVDIHTLPPVSIDTLRITPGKHTVVAADAPQGYLQLKMAGSSNAARGLQCIVRQNGSFQTLNVQNFGDTEKYITGRYDLEVLSLPRIKLDDIDITQSHTTTIEIPEPGIAVLRKSFNGYGTLLLNDKNTLTRVYELNETLTLETLYLQPGSYRIVFRPKISRSTLYTVEQNFIIESGKTTDIQLYK
jgi:Ca-activated chloride channel family protein